MENLVYLKYKTDYNEIMELSFDGKKTQIKHSDFLDDFIDFNVTTIFKNYILSDDEKEIIRHFCSLIYIMK